MAPPVVRVIVGPTAAGKSAVAAWLAARHPTLLISADSRQIYRDFDVGTAKPSGHELLVAPHRGVDVVPPTHRYSAAAWADAAEGWLDEAATLGRAPVVVGGTGFYLRALFSPLFEEPPLDPVRRRAIEPVLGAMPLETLRRWCEALDPERAHLGRTQLLRAIEIALLTGERLSAWHRRAPRPPRRRARYLLVDPGPALGERIARRARAMLAGGWVQEVERLVARVPAPAPAWKASGYLAVRRHVEGHATWEQTLESIIIETRQYAKRQRTWFRHQLPADDVTPLDPTQRGWEEIASRWWSATGRGSAEDV